MAGDKKTIKFQMMMSPSEAEALDDWGFARRIRSRAEAIRQLIQRGLTYDVLSKRSDVGNEIIMQFLRGQFPPMELIADYIEQAEFEVESLRARNQLARKVSEELLAASILNENPDMPDDEADLIARQHFESQFPTKVKPEILPNSESRLALVEEIRKSARERSEAQPSAPESKDEGAAASQQIGANKKAKRVLNTRKAPKP